MHRVRHFVCVAVWLVCSAMATRGVAAQAQSGPAPSLAFDVVLIKPGKPGCASVGIGGFSAGDFQADCYSLKVIIAYANGCDVRDERILGGPVWIDAANFDLEAKVDASDLDAYSKLSRSEIGQMLQVVLAERSA